MEILLKVVGGALISLILYFTLSKYNSDLGALLVIVVCCMIGFVILSYLEPVIAFIKHLQHMSGIHSDKLSVLLKSVGIALIMEIVSLLCKDFGNGAFAKLIQLLASVVIVWISIPIFDELLMMIEAVLEAL